MSKKVQNDGLDGVDPIYVMLAKASGNWHDKDASLKVVSESDENIQSAWYQLVSANQERDPFDEDRVYDFTLAQLRDIRKRLMDPKESSVRDQRESDQKALLLSRKLQE